MKKFVGLYFHTKNQREWQIVPKSWIFNINAVDKCYWPTAGDVESLARDEAPVDKIRWSVWPVREIAITSGKLCLLTND